MGEGQSLEDPEIRLVMAAWAFRCWSLRHRGLVYHVDHSCGHFGLFGLNAKLADVVLNCFGCWNGMFLVLRVIYMKPCAGAPFQEWIYFLAFSQRSRFFSVVRAVPLQVNLLTLSQNQLQDEFHK